MIIVRYADIQREFGINTMSLPAPSAQPASDGILSIGGPTESFEASRDKSSLDGDDYLDSTWKIHPSDLQCKMQGGKPVLLGSGVEEPER